jgi:hypothetical protein
MLPVYSGYTSGSEQLAGNKTFPWKFRSRKRRNPVPWGCNLATLSLGDIFTETWPSSLGVGRRADGLDP